MIKQIIGERRSLARITIYRRVRVRMCVCVYIRAAQREIRIQAAAQSISRGAFIAPLEFMRRRAIAAIRNGTTTTTTTTTWRRRDFKRFAVEANHKAFSAIVGAMRCRYRCINNTRGWSGKFENYNIHTAAACVYD